MKKKIIEKWYKKLSFPTRYDEQFYTAIESCNLDEIEKIEDYVDFTDKERNLVAFLYFCEALCKKYNEYGIPESILSDTLSDIVIWTNTYYGIYGKLGLDETGWLKRHLTFKLFKLGRLQFCIAKSEHTVPEWNFCVGDDIVEVHIPEAGPLVIEECYKSFDNARSFFKEYFPDYNYKCFTCHSWLLDRALLPYLKEGANITKFMNMFTPVIDDPSNALIKYIFRWDATVESLHTFEPRSSFATKIKEAVLSGVQFHETLGVVAK